MISVVPLVVVPTVKSTVGTLVGKFFLTAGQHAVKQALLWGAGKIGARRQRSRRMKKFMRLGIPGPS